ncbi:radical SAM protein [Aestuariirhabdus litorea]|uniref:Radical SAM protein n=1 Tax=Aestuariirhabdus litorea TaxID=2528527 RepID=A0A3P3VR75_9GAMM|nr:radical SAM protein [Aestuariirhabdus litorea]RRJ84029.1 radical SAM protein [Aestuariirhabdus litorea]RWW97249.1 radical SAM protein [Endozoicomonadaceae bacterium GTF-13]
MSNYRLTANIEWTSKCNAKCAMCPRHVIDRPKLMTREIYRAMMSRLEQRDLVRAIVAGFGEPTTHPLFMEFVEGTRDHPVHFDMVSNGERLDAEKVRHLDGALGMVMVSFSSIDPDVYKSVHTNLDQQRVMENLKFAQRELKQTHLSVSLTPMPECLDTLPETIEWFHQQGITDLRMSPNFYNRAGSIEEQDIQTRTLRQIIERYKLKALDLDFVPGAMDVVKQLRSNKFNCIPRNSSMFITSDGNYLYCYNDMSHHHSLGNVREMSVREAIERRELTGVRGELCDQCNMRGRYQGVELAQMAAKYMGSRLIAAVG